VKLSEIERTFGLTVVRDGIFECFAPLSGGRADAFSYLTDQRFVAELRSARHVCAVVTTAELADSVPQDIALAVADDPADGFYQSWMAYGRRHVAWTDFPSEIDPGAEIHPTAYVAPTGVRIGAGSRIMPNATILERSILGRNVTIWSGTVIGGEGCQVQRVRGKQIAVPHYCGVVIGDDVTIMTNCSVAWGLFEDTTIGNQTILDNLVHVAHSVKVGDGCRLLACTMIAGSTVIANGARLGPNCTISDSLHLGENARITLGAVVVRDVPDGGHVSGNFAVDHRKLIAFYKTLR
jgi:UDP-3-O-[3-hydroxymyristoyl] glucosamine N-acyltransferase